MSQPASFLLDLSQVMLAHFSVIEEHQPQGWSQGQQHQEEQPTTEVGQEVLHGTLHEGG